MLKTCISIIFTLTCLACFSRGKKDYASRVASLPGFPFTLEQLKEIKPYDDNYRLTVSIGKISLKEKAFNLRLFIRFKDMKTRKSIYAGSANFVFIGEKVKKSPDAISARMKKLCPT